MNLWSQEAYLAAWNYASHKHRNQKVPGTDTPYAAHLGSVAMEVMTAVAARGDVSDPDLAVQCALLHDVVEDAEVALAEVAEHFGAAVAAGVGALTKDAQLATKGEQMQDSLERIRLQPHEVWMVKLADRITNLQPPPKHWTSQKIRAYREEAETIHAALASACPVLGARLTAKIAQYSCNDQ